MSPRERFPCERCDETGELGYRARIESMSGIAAHIDTCPDCHGHGFLLVCRCGYCMPVGESMCSLCESQAEAREEER